MSKTKAKEFELTPEQIKEKEREQNLKFPIRNGYYWSNGKDIVFDNPKPRVTDILNVLSKDQLLYWAMKNVAKICLDKGFPILDEKEAIREHYRRNVTGKADIGSRVHHLVSKVLKGEVKLEETVIGEDIQPHIESFKSFLIIENPTLILSEQIVWTNDYAGQFDALLKINDKVILVDFKSGKGVYTSYGLQLSAYKHAILDMKLAEKIDYMAVVNLKDDGCYSLTYMNEPIEIFYKCLDLFNYLKKEE